MPLSMPMWPHIFTVTPPPHPAQKATPVPIRRRWMIVDDTVHREVDEAEFRAALASSNGSEIAHDPYEDVVTHLCFRAHR